MEPIEALLNNIKNKTLLAIFPHPDDETMVAGGLLLRAKQMGFKTVVCILTRGGAGQMHIHPRGKTIKQVREIELERATRRLSITKLILEDFDDGKLRENNEWIERVRKIINEIKPGVVVTFDPSGWSGHPDHIATCIEIKKILNGQDTILLWPARDPDRKKWVNKNVANFMPEATHTLDTTRLRSNVFWAGSAYRSQRFGPTHIHPWFTLLFIMMRFKNEWYHRVDFGKSYKHKFVKFDI